MADVDILDVLLHREPIGTLTRVGGDQTLFAFNDAYVADEDRPVLGLSFKDQLGGLLTVFRPTRTRLMPFFSNLLPEGHLRTYVAQRAGVNPVREFFLLWVLGADLPGAVAIRPADHDAWPSDESGADDDHRRGNALRFSLAGMQLKLSAVMEASGGLTIPARGIGGSWIVKLPSRRFARVPENEFSMLTLARLSGMDVPAFRLVDVAAIANLPEGLGTTDGQALAIERFDRSPAGGAVHVEDFAQVFGVYPEDKYRRASARNIGGVIGAECRGDDIVEFIRRLTFNTLIGNADMHLKNWSLIYPDRRHAALAPAYDFVSTIAYLPDDCAALKFSRTRRFSGVLRGRAGPSGRQGVATGKARARCRPRNRRPVHQHWRGERRHLPLAAEAAQAIAAHLQTIPIA